MGWFGSYNYVGKTKDYVISEFSKDACEVLACSQYGREFYLAVRVFKFNLVVGFVVLASRKKNGEIMTKTMDETMGPYFYHCPKKIIYMLSPTNHEYALKWRQENLKQYKNKQEINTMKKIFNEVNEISLKEEAKC